MQEIPSGFICPSCKCPIAAPSGRSIGMHCPRCNTWLDIDAGCNGGSCFSCSVAHDATTAVCVETSNVHFAPAGENCGSNVVQRSSWMWAGMTGSINALRRLGKSFYHRLFHVR